MSAWLYFDSGRSDPALNMALDDLLLRSVGGVGLPVLRFYQWNQPAATFGYFQKIADLEAATPLRPLIRRPTGGGLVPHVDDWTYSLVIPPDHPWHSLKAVDSYRQMHEWIRAALGEIGLPCELAGCCRKEIPGQCFAGHEKHDVLHHGRKIAGAAQRRNNLGLLIQGSVQPGPAVAEREPFIKAMVGEGDRLFKGNAGKFDPVNLLGAAEDLAASCYRSEHYNRRR